VATAFSHAAAALAIGACFYKPQIPARTWVLGAICSVFPDLDVIGFKLGIRYADFWGHRGITHSLVFAALLATVAIVIWFRERIPSITRLYLCTYLFIATASHGVFDAMTDGGLGVAFFSPFDNRRYFFPWRPIRVSPIGIGRFFSERCVAVIQSEFIWIWIPAVLLASAALLLRRHGRPANG
jgi:inner membrane protein